EHHFALVDEADNIFIDEARTPLIIANPTRNATPAEQVVYHWANQLAQKMTPSEHFFLDEKKQKIELTLAGRQLLRYSNPPLPHRPPPGGAHPRPHGTAPGARRAPPPGPAPAPPATSPPAARGEGSPSARGARGGPGPTATGARGCTRPSRPRRACRSRWP